MWIAKSRHFKINYSILNLAYFVNDFLGNDPVEQSASWLVNRKTGVQSGSNCLRLVFISKEGPGMTVALRNAPTALWAFSFQLDDGSHLNYAGRAYEDVSYPERKIYIRAKVIILEDSILTIESILSILTHGAWNGGTLVDNSVYEDKGMSFKNNIPVNSQTIEERIGVRTRIAAPEDVRIGVLAMHDLLANQEIDPAQIKFLIGATNVGEDKYDPGPLIRFPLELIKKEAPDVVAIDLYAGCPGFNVAVELLFMLSIDGILSKDDLSVIVGAENLHRAKAFRPLDTATIIFGDDALATAFQSHGSPVPVGQYTADETITGSMGNDPIDTMARAILDITGNGRIDGLIIDNQLGKIEYRVPAIAARVQQRLAELMYPDAC